MKQVNRQNQYAEFSMTISTSRELWRYLFRGQKNSSEKLTRVEAFHDLIERQYAALQQENECIFGSISSLSRSWHWDRDTTSAFIADLEKFGAVSRYDIGKRAVFPIAQTIEQNSISNTPSLDLLVIMEYSPSVTKHYHLISMRKFHL